MQLIGAVILLICLPSSLSLSCLNEDNSPVDWFIVYKIPTIKHSNNLISTGVAYTYMTSNDYQKWKFSNISINSTDSIIGKTMKNFYNNPKNDLLYILYNNEPPDHISNKGHTKGFVLANNQSGLWLIHSVPHFPKISNYSYPSTGTKFGQHFLCVSMDFENLNKVGIQLQYNQPQIYSQYVPTELKTSLPELTKAAFNVTNKAAPWYNILLVTSKQGIEFVSFAKSSEFRKELYEDLVAPYLSSDLLVETWPNGPGRLMSNCTKQFKVNNVETVYLNVANVTFGTHQDHSKWAISSVNSSQYYTCIGDINREEHQKVRGGGTLCFNNKTLTTNYQKIVTSIEPCGTKNKTQF